MFVKGIIIFTLLLALCTTPGPKGAQAGESPGGVTSPMPSSSNQPLPLEPKTPLEMLLRGEGGGGQNYIPLWKFNNIGLAGTAALTDNPEVVAQPRVGAKLNLAKNTELRVSFLYNKENPAAKGEGSTPSHLLFKYDMDYQLMPNLQVGLSGYFYQPYASDYLTWRNSKLQEPVLGLGPGIRYNLGRWNFMFKTQLQTSSHAHADSLHNWFRVWYAF